MSNKQQIANSHKPSALDQFQISFEYNKTLQDIKREVRIRTM